MPFLNVIISKYTVQMIVEANLQRNDILRNMK